MNLNDNVIGYYEFIFEEVILTWQNPNKQSELFHKVSFLTFEKDTYQKTQNVYTKKDAVKIANKLIDSYKD